MKSLWKCLVQSAIVIGVSTCSTSTLLAQDDGQAGIVRISKPKTRDVMRGNVTLVNGMQCADGSVNPSAPVTSCDPGMGCPCFGSMGSCDGGCDFGYGTGRRRDWRTTDWRTSDAWGSGLRARLQSHGLACENSICRQGAYSPEMRGHASGNAMVDYFKCKFGYFVPTGGGGQGIPWVGHYGRVYPENPAYSDPRDGQAYAAQGYGIPMAVPLAPVVGHTYEYSNGVPSSRLTPVSHPAY